MADKLTEWQVLILWALLAEGGASYRSQLLRKKMIPGEDKPHREGLVKAGLITSEDRPGKGKGKWLEVTDKGWNEASQNLSAALPSTQKSSAVLQAWLTRLQTFMQARGLVLADILGPQDSAQGVAVDGGAAKPLTPARLDYAALRQRVRQAYLDVTGGRFNTRALLSDLRGKLHDIERGTLDEALSKMHLEEGTTLSGLNNPREITPAIRDAGLNFKGEWMFVIWITK